MAVPSEVTARVQRLRAGSDCTRLAAEGEDGDAVVQLAVRVLPALRDDIHAAARAEGCSTQDWVNRVLRAAVVERSDPHLRLAGRLLDELRVELSQAVESGAYERFTAELGDPDLVDR